MPPNHSELEKTDVIVLCGGLGTRLQGVLQGKPKILAEIQGRPFLDILLNHLTAWGFERVILSVGHLRDQVISHVNRFHRHRRIAFSIEERQLGTGGALRNAAPLINSDHVFVMNGDSACAVDFQAFYESHRERGALLSMALAPLNNPDGGLVRMDTSGKLLHFEEKAVSPEGFLSAGIYLMDKKIFSFMPQGEVFSLERDFFPSLLQEPCFGFMSASECVDIGTPERYDQAQEAVLKIYSTRFS